MQARKLGRCAAAAVAAALMAVPVAQARLAVDAQHAALLNRETVVRTDARHAALLNKYPHVVPVIVQDRGESKIGQVQHLNRPAGQTAVGNASSFDWADAGIGAGAVFGLVLLAGGGVLLSRRRLVTA